MAKNILHYSQIATVYNGILVIEATGPKGDTSPARLGGLLYMTDVRILLAHNMKRCRQILGLSQMALAERIGCSTTLVGNIETLKRFPSPENLNLIAQALDVHPSELFMENSPAIARMQNAYEVRERLERNVQKAIEDTLINPPTGTSNRGTSKR